MQLNEQQQHLVMWVIFGITYLGIALGEFPRLVLDRTGIALLGAIAMLLVRGVSIQEAANHIDYPTMLLLFGLMIFSAQLRVAGFYVWAGAFLKRLADRPRMLLAGLTAVSGLLSALLANDIVCLAFAPLLCQALLRAGRDPTPYLLVLATSSNIGSAATIIGNPQNMYIGTVASLSFGHFSLVMIPAVLLGLAVCWGMTVLLYRRDLARAGPDGHRLEEADLHEGETLVPSSLPLQTHQPDQDMYLIGKTLLILGFLVLYFILERGPDAAQRRAVAALAGAGLLLCSHRAKAAKLYQMVDWNLLLLFLSLFVVNGAMQERHLTQRMLQAIAGTGLRLDDPATLSAVTLVLSNLVSNVPAVLLLAPPVAAADQTLLWYLLALVSTWAGNLTLVGSIANLIVAESAAAYGVVIDLKTYCRLGVPLTLATSAAGLAWLMLVL